MKIHQLRNATFIIEAENNFILIDPMLGEKGTITPFSFIRNKAKRNPLVSLPVNASNLLEKVSHCLITHRHPDHLDKEGKYFLIENKIPVVCGERDAANLIKKGLFVKTVLELWQNQNFIRGNIKAIPTKHGYGWIHLLMGNGIGFYLELPNSPSLYITGDTIFTDAVHKVLSELKPDLSVVASGCAKLDIGKPLIMTITDIIKFVELSQGKVIANHLEALNHCQTTRSLLRERLTKKRLIDKVYIPNDGETINA
jgi:L-ascorbate metabolism protein UlaG (beta-lactamase superfamily)